MFFPSATVVGAMVISLAGTSPIEARTAARAPHVTGAPAARAVAGLWAPKKSKPKSARDDEQREEELLKPRAPTGETGAKPAKRRPIKMDDSADQGDEEGDDGDADGDEEDKPKVTKKRKRIADEDEEADEPIPSQPSVIPRLINVGLGTALVRRTFAYTNTVQQGDKGLRLGYQIALESFPAVTQPGGWYRTLGVGAWYEKEYGDATHDAAGGMFTGYPFSQSRWGFDARYGIPAGEWVVIMPAIGYGRAGADLQRMQPVAPSGCAAASSTDPCFGDINVSYLAADLHVRVGFSPAFAMSLSGGYLQGLGVARGMDQITAEASASMKGFHVDLGASFLLNEWFAVQAAIPFRRYAFNFDRPANASFTYRGATDTYYGLIAGLAVFTK